MKYDPELMLQLAQLVEEQPADHHLSLDEIQLPQASRDQVVEHCKLLIAEQLVLGKVQSADDHVYDLWLTRLTLQGHQFLLVARDQTKWQKFIKLAQAGLGFITAEGFKLALADILKNLLH